MKNPNMPAVVIPLPPRRQEPNTSVLGDPYARPAGEVTVAEWRVMICTIAGPKRLSQGFSREIPIPAGEVKLLAQNDKSYALFVFGQARVLPAAFVIAGDPRATNPDNGIRVLNVFEQVLLPKEKLYGFSIAGVTLVITEVTV